MTPIFPFIMANLFPIMALLAIATGFLIPYLRHRAYKRAVEMPAIKAAAIFWSEALRQDEEKGFSPGRIEKFRENIVELLAEYYLSNNKTLPAIGNFYWEPHNCGPHPILAKAACCLPLYEHRLPHFLPMIEMRLTEDQVKIRRIMQSNDFRTIWEPGDDLQSVATVGKIHRPS